MVGIWVLVIMVYWVPASIALGYGIYQVVVDARIEKNPVLVVGEILSIELRNFSGRRSGYNLEATYVLDGAKYERAFKINSEEVIQYKVGDDVTVICQRDVPKNAALSSRELKEYGFSYIFFAVFFFVLGAIVCFLVSNML